MSDTVWVKTEPSFDGSTYVVTVTASDDTARTLTPEEALRYASGVLRAAQRAVYDAAVLRQLMPIMKNDIASVGQVIKDLREDRPPLNEEVTAPLTFEPGVNAKREPFLVVKISGEPVGQWTVLDAREHAFAVLQATERADLDTGYYRALTGLVGVDGPRARNVVEDIMNWG